MLPPFFSTVECKPKSGIFDGKPFRIEVKNSLGIPLYFASFSSESKCLKVRDLFIEFMSRYKDIRSDDTV